MIMSRNAFVGSNEKLRMAFLAKTLLRDSKRTPNKAEQIAQSIQLRIAQEYNWVYSMGIPNINRAVCEKIEMVTARKIE